MAGFSELVRSLDKIRDYMRDFYVYGFKQRGDFDRKSPRTYDNEKRRIESYLGGYVRWRRDRDGKAAFISVDSAAVARNPLYAAWKSKSFTDRDIALHFHILDALYDGGALGVEELANRVSLRSGLAFDTQTVRNKCGEYVREGLLRAEKKGRALIYSRTDRAAGGGSAPAGGRVDGPLLDAVKFYSEAAPFGEVGSFILDNARAENALFRFKHHYIVHTLEDGVLLDLLRAMREERAVRFVNSSPRTGADVTVSGVPLKILHSAATGRRYVLIYTAARRRFVNYRLDYIRRVEPGEVQAEYGELRDAAARHLPLVWGTSFGGRTGRRELLCLKLFIDEVREGYVLDRLRREGRGGEILRVEDNVFLYTRELYDTSEASPWIKTFTGRILALESTNRAVVDRFYRDMARLKRIYAEAADTTDTTDAAVDDAGGDDAAGGGEEAR